MKATSLHFQNIAFLFLKYCNTFYEITFFLMGIYMQFRFVYIFERPIVRVASTAWIATYLINSVSHFILTLESIAQGQNSSK